jgi:hypothetical protein
MNWNQFQRACKKAFLVQEAKKDPDVPIATEFIQSVHQRFPDLTISKRDLVRRAFINYQKSEQ